MIQTRTILYSPRFLIFPIIFLFFELSCHILPFKLFLIRVCVTSDPFRQSNLLLLPFFPINIEFAVEHVNVLVEDDGHFLEVFKINHSHFEHQIYGVQNNKSPIYYSKNLMFIVQKCLFMAFLKT